MARPRVLLGDDHAMFCEGLRSILEPHFEVVGIVENGQELVTAAERLQPDVVVADVSMPLLNGIGAARKLQKMKRSSQDRVSDHACGPDLRHRGLSRRRVWIRSQEFARQ